MEEGERANEDVFPNLASLGYQGQTLNFLGGLVSDYFYNVHQKEEKKINSPAPTAPKI